MAAADGTRPKKKSRNLTESPDSKKRRTDSPSEAHAEASDGFERWCNSRELCEVFLEDWESELAEGWQYVMNFVDSDNEPSSSFNIPKAHIPKIPDVSSSSSASPRSDSSYGSAASANACHDVSPSKSNSGSDTHRTLPRPSGSYSSTECPSITMGLQVGDMMAVLHNIPTNQWNEKHNAELIYRLLNVSAWIVHPNHLLSQDHSSNNEEHQIDNILRNLEEFNSRDEQWVAWRTVSNAVEEFTSIFSSQTAKLANVFRNKDEAQILWKKFESTLLKTHTKRMKISPGFLTPIYNCVKEFKKADPDNCQEDLLAAYIKALIDFFQSRLGDQRFAYGPTKLKLDLPEYKVYAAHEKDVSPDFVLYHGYTNRIFLVGEVKSFGSHSRKYESQVKDLPRSGEGVKNRSHQPRPGASTGEIGDGGENEDRQEIIRRLDNAEKYKVSCYLPQLLGQMIAALQRNKCESSDESSIFQVGFAVEGFKLRFVKLVIRSCLKNKTSYGRPLAKEVLKGHNMKCDVFMTQEFNLLKGSHVKMFFQMLLAIVFRSIDVD